MTNPKLTLHYFPIGGRAEPIRLACVAGGVAFTNNVISFQDFMGMKETLPNGQVPVIDIEKDGEKETIGQSGAILRYVGKLGGLYPTDPSDALKVDAVIDMVDDFTGPLGTALYLSKSLISEKDLSEEEKLAFRSRFATIAIPKYFSMFEEMLIKSSSGWICGDKITIADTKLFQAISWVTNGTLDGIPTSCIDDYPNLLAHFNKVKEYESIKAWYDIKGDGYYKTSDYNP